MNEDPDEGLGEARLIGSARQDRTEAALVGGELTFNEAALAVEVEGETLAESSTQRRCGPLSTSVASIEPDDALGDSEDFAGQVEIVLGVVAGVGQDAVERDALMGLFDQRMEVGGIGRGAQGDPGRQEERRLKFADDDELDPAGPLQPPRRMAIAVILADVARVEAGRVDGGDGLIGNQATIAGASEAGVEEGLETPFFTRRCSATQRVE